MKEDTDHDDTDLSERMAGRFEIEDLGDPARQKQISDAIAALDGVLESKIENGALYVSYDPLVTSEKKIEEAIRSTGSSIKTAATDTQAAHPDLPTTAATNVEEPGIT